jgi:hypothetical protein
LIASYGAFLREKTVYSHSVENEILTQVNLSIFL